MRRSSPAPASRVGFVCGLPGTGKGTLLSDIESRGGVVVSLGDILRGIRDNRLAEDASETDKKLQQAVREGMAKFHVAPDIVHRVVEDYLLSQGCMTTASAASCVETKTGEEQKSTDKPFQHLVCIDGIPRNADNVVFIQSLVKRGVRASIVRLVVEDDALLLARLQKRETTNPRGDNVSVDDLRRRIKLEKDKWATVSEDAQRLVACLDASGTAAVTTAAFCAWVESHDN